MNPILINMILKAGREKREREQKEQQSKLWLAEKNRDDLSKVKLDRPEWGQGTVAPTPTVRLCNDRIVMT